MINDNKMPDTLEVARHEKKYLINPMQLVALTQMLTNVLIEDKHNGNAGYFIRSLYFDSYDETDFYQKKASEEIRKKIRLRAYSLDDEYVKLEIKRKTGDDQVKKSAVISREDAESLIECKYEVLMKYDNSTANMIYQIMRINRLRPVVMVEFIRRAFIHPTNNIRITLDRNIRSNESNFKLFDKSVTLSPVEEFASAVVEVKYDAFIIGWLSELLSNFEAMHTDYSKYCTSRKLFDSYLA